MLYLQQQDRLSVTYICFSTHTHTHTHTHTYTHTQSIHTAANVVLHYSKFVTAVPEIIEIATGRMCM
jgi:hypothetical protein